MAPLRAVFAAALGLPALVLAAPAAVDPCAKVAGLPYAVPKDAFACLKSFPFNETIRQNVLSNVARVFDFYTFEDYYYNSPDPYTESTVDIRGEIARINSTTYATDYDFNRDLYDFTNMLNDGHTRWFPNCYTSYQNLLPAPITSLEVNGTENVYVVPDLVEFINLVGTNYTAYFDSIKFDWKRLAGAKVLEIEGKTAYDYVDFVARTQSGNYLDHGIRVNSVYSSYRISANAFSQRFGDLAGPSFPDQDGLTYKVITANSTQEETVYVPFLASFVGSNFTDQASYWAHNCAPTNVTNGVDYRTAPPSDSVQLAERRRLAKRIDVAPGTAVGLPPKYIPGLPALNGSDAVIKSFILPDNNTGVMFVGSFEPDNYTGFIKDTVSAVAALKAANVTRLLIDLTNNGGGYICLGEFLHQYLAGSKIGYPGFQTSMRAGPLAQKIVAANIELGLNMTNYAPGGWAFLNDTVMDNDYNYDQPIAQLAINGKSDPESQRFHDICTPFNIKMPEEPPFDLKNVAIVGNGNCASTCAMFSTLMYEKYSTKVAVFGGKPGETMQYRGMAGNQVLEWADLDSEVKTAGLANDPLAPPELIVNGNMRVNWRTAWSFKDENTPIAYLSEPAQYRYPYTLDTYANPLNLWTFAAKTLLP